MTRHTWLIPLDPAPDPLRATLRALDDCAIPYITVSPLQARGSLNENAPPSAIVHGGGLSAELIDVQRWLAEFAVPTLVLVEGLTDDHEASLLDRGARDVVGIPSSSRRLRSRLDALVRPQRHGSFRTSLPSMVRVVDVIEIRPRPRTVDVRGQRVNFTKSEFDLLLALALHAGDVMLRSELSAATGKMNLSDRALESHISRIRTKLRAAGAPDCITSVRSVGYRLQGAR